MHFPDRKHAEGSVKQEPTIQGALFERLESYLFAWAFNLQLRKKKKDK